MPEGVVLNSIEGRQLGLDDVGNLVLNTAGIEPASPLRGAPGLVGKGIPFNCAITAAAGTTNVSNVTFQIQDVLGNALAGVFTIDIILSDAATGAGLTATTASGGIAAGAAGAVLGVLTAAKAIKAQTDTTGKFILAITDSAKTPFYPVAQVFNTLKAQVGTRLITANYG